MTHFYRIHFGYSKRSKYYPQAVELAKLAYRQEIIGEGDNIWHTVTLAEDQLDLMASLYVIAVKLPGPKVYGADVLYTSVYCGSEGTYNYFNASAAYKKRVCLAVERLKNETGKSLKELEIYLSEKYLKPIRNDMQNVREKLILERRVDYIDPKTQTWVRAKNKPIEPINAYREIRESIAEKRYSEAVDVYYLSLGNRYYGELTPELIYLKRLVVCQT